MQYFTNCRTIEEVKSLYKKLAMEHHPDRGGDTSIMQKINTEYAVACAHIVKGSGMSDAEADTEIKILEEYRRIIEQIIRLPEILVEIIGVWIWLTGNTYPVRKKLKGAGLYFASKKGAWYYRNEHYKMRGNGTPLEEIRAKYGAQTVNSPFFKKLHYKKLSWPHFTNERQIYLNNCCQAMISSINNGRAKVLCRCP